MGDAGAAERPPETPETQDLGPGTYWKDMPRAESASFWD